VTAAAVEGPLSDEDARLRELLVEVRDVMSDDWLDDSGLSLKNQNKVLGLVAPLQRRWDELWLYHPQLFRRLGVYR
jgi:hypothetical protein